MNINNLFGATLTSVSILGFLHFFMSGVSSGRVEEATGGVLLGLLAPLCAHVTWRKKENLAPASKV